MRDRVTIRRALVSVSDKTGVVELARALASKGVAIISTGGTATALRTAGVAVTPIEEVTGFPEMMDGRVKTLHPKIHGGLLALRDEPSHAAAMGAHAIEPIDLLVVNLYPFEKTVEKLGGASAGRIDEEAVENIDIGGPAMVRSASKNHGYVAVLTSPAQYERFLAEFNESGATSLATRRRLAAEAFTHTAKYDGAISAYLMTAVGAEAGAEKAGGVSFPPTLALSYEKVQDCRYGENPHQPAAVYREAGYAGPSVVGARQLHGKELSYNNVNDAAAALELALGLAAGAKDLHAAAVIKHANPCGAATARSARGAVEAALAGDPLAAFGGILACSGVLDDEAAARLSTKDVFLEVVIAAGFSQAALATLRAKSAGVRLLAFGGDAAAARSGERRMYRSFAGGMLAQVCDDAAPTPGAWTLAAGPAPDAGMLAAAGAIEVMARAMSSNAIAIGVAGESGGAMLVGGGLGQVDRVTACRLAVAKAGERARGAIAVSDGFFPFPDGPGVLIEGGVTMIVQPGGSKRDAETFELCAKHGVTCMVTGVRRFRH